MQATYFLVPFLSLSFKDPNLQRSSGGSRQDAAFTNACVASSCCSSSQGAASLRLQRMNWRWEHGARLWFCTRQSHAVAYAPGGAALGVDFTS